MKFININNNIWFTNISKEYIKETMCLSDVRIIEDRELIKSNNFNKDSLNLVNYYTNSNFIVIEDLEDEYDLYFNDEIFTKDEFISKFYKSNKTHIIYNHDGLKWNATKVNAIVDLQIERLEKNKYLIKDTGDICILRNSELGDVLLNNLNINIDKINLLDNCTYNIDLNQDEV